MSSWQPLASPAPPVSGVNVETCVVEPATVDPVPFAEAPFAEPCAPVEMPIAKPILDAEERIIPAVAVEDSVEDYKYMSYDTLTIMEGESDFEAYAAVLQGNPSKGLLQKFQSFLTTGNFHERDFVAYGEVRFCFYIVVHKKRKLIIWLQTYVMVGLIFSFCFFFECRFVDT
jgi:hypothetical protein